MSALTSLWVNRDNFTDHIAELPASFNVDKKLHTAINRVIDNWLTDLIGESNIETIRSELQQKNEVEDWSESLKKWMKSLVPFLVHASWSEHILVANVTYAANGPVTVYSEGAEPISDQQRAKISQMHKGYAETYALKLVKLAQAEKCAPNKIGSGRPSIKSAGGKRQSRFD